MLILKLIMAKLFKIKSKRLFTVTRHPYNKDLGPGLEFEKILSTDANS